MTSSTVCTVAILSDTHGFLDPRIRERVSDCDYAVHAGDIGGADVLFALQPRRAVIAVRGNNDTAERWGGSESHLLGNLPLEATLDLPGGTLVVVHGDDGRSLPERHRALRERYADAHLVVYGHSHRLFMETQGRPWLVNPGAAGRVRTFGGPSWVLLRCDGERWALEALRLPAMKVPDRSSHRRRSRLTM